MTNEVSGWAIGWTMFASTMMLLIGFWHAIAGMVGLFQEDFYVVGEEYVFRFNVTTWGWVHLILGVVIIFAGLGLYRGAVWARTLGVIMAAISAVAAFAWVPYYPIWALMIAASAVFVIWALTAHGKEFADL